MSFTRVFDIIHHQQATAPLTTCLARRENKKEWIHYTTEQVIVIANKISTALLNLNLQQGDKVAIIATTNRPEWHFVDIACSQIGLVTVPIYPTISTSDYEYIFNHAAIKVLFLSDKVIHRKVKNIIATTPTIQQVYSFDKIDEIPQLNELYIEPNIEAIEARKDIITPHNLATIIYTSGTTGTPKGVMLSHNNIVSNVKAALQVIPVQQKTKALSFLPLCHVFERTINYCYLAACCSIYYADGLETISENLQDIKPDYFSTVPRLLEKVFEKIVKKGEQLPTFQKSIFFNALKLAESTPLGSSKGLATNLQFLLADSIIFKKWRLALGNNIKAIICGSAPLQPRLATIFTNAGIPVLEGYGLTECSPVVSVIPLDKKFFRAGCVGKILPNVEVKLAKDGEILVKAPSVMLGYYKNEQATKDTFSEDGYLLTGDIGEFTQDGFLKITDRKKELFKTSGGKYVAPSPIENKIKESFFIEQVALVGDGEKFVSVIVYPSFDELKLWAAKQQITFSSNKELIENLQVIKHYKEIICNFNTFFGRVEQVKEVILTDVEWTVDNGLVTPTLKLKRKNIKNFYKKEIDLIYKK